MYNMAKRVTIGTVILLLPTLAIWLSDWQWQPGGNNTWLKGFFLGDRNGNCTLGHTDQCVAL